MEEKEVSALWNIQEISAQLPLPHPCTLRTEDEAEHHMCEPHQGKAGCMNSHQSLHVFTHHTLWEGGGPDLYLH